MTKQIEAMKLALNALDTCRVVSFIDDDLRTEVTPKNVTAAINALREALAQPTPMTQARADVIERQSRALHEIAEEWAGSECGVPLYASEAYAIGLAKRMYALAVEGLTPHEHLGHDSDCAVHNMPAYPNGLCDCGMSSAALNKKEPT